METSKVARSNQWLHAVCLVVAMSLATLFLAAWIWGLQGMASVHADHATRYVDGVTGSDMTDCTNPVSPCATIDYALDQAGDGDTILVAQGTYTDNLVITKAVTLKGGYESRDWSQQCLHHCTTTIDGNQGGRVIEVRSTLSETTVIDGFTITNGDGGISIALSSVAIQNCRIVHNHATANLAGGGIDIDHAFVAITNTLIVTNTADLWDGAIRITSATHITAPNSVVTIANSTIANNRAPERNGIFCSLSGCTVINSIVWGHEGEDFGGHGYSATYSDIEMGLPGERNISEDPRFVDPTSGNYHLQSDSPCIDKGTNENAPEIDFEGDPRPFDGDSDGFAVVDMGADEWFPLTPTVTTIRLEEGARPIAVAVNPNDNYVYVVNIGTGKVSVINGTELLTTIDLKTVETYPASACPGETPYGSCLNGVGVNTVTNHVYVTEWYHDVVQIISGTEVIDWVYAGKGPADVVPHPNNDSIYALDKWIPGVTFIQGDQDRCFNSMPGCEPEAGVVAPSTGYVYIAGGSCDSVMVISNCTKIADIPVGSYPNAVAYSPSTGYIYVVNSGDSPATVSVISGTQVIGTIPVGTSSTNLGVNPFWGIERDGSTHIIAASPTGYIYVANWGSNSVSILSDVQKITDVVVGANPNAVGVDPVSGYVYVANVRSDNVSLISTTQVINTVAVGAYPFDLAVSPTAGYVYVANRNSDSVSIISLPPTPTPTPTNTSTSTPTPTTTATATPSPTPSPTNTLPPTMRVWLPLVMKNWCPPSIEFTYVPPCRSFEDLQGQVRCVEPADYKVAVYIYVSGWWTKPYLDSPLTTIRGDGTWTCDITTGGTDQLATKIAAFLVPDGYDPPLILGGQTLPSELWENSVAWVMEERECIFRKIEFSGYTWNVKASETPAGPGPNYFSDQVEDVWVDKDGRLHLRIVQRNGRWYCTEVFTEAPLGYGKYIFHVASRVDQLDKNIVLGLFTWDDTVPEYNYREIDIEFARWGEAENDNAQYVVQPYDHPGNMYRFNMELRGDDSTHGFDWRADRVFFQSLYGDQPFPGSEEDEIASWTYTGDDIPPAGEGNARINLWLNGGNPPSNGEEAEVIIEAFEFVPQTE